MPVKSRTSRVKNGTFQTTNYKTAVSSQLITLPVSQIDLHDRQFAVTGGITTRTELYSLNVPAANHMTEGLSECTAK